MSGEVVYVKPADSFNPQPSKVRLSTTDNPVLEAHRIDLLGVGIPELVKLQQGTVIRGVALESVLAAMRAALPDEVEA